VTGIIDEDNKPDVIHQQPRLVLPISQQLTNRLQSRTTWVSQYQKGKTSLDLHKARYYGVLEWQWHQLDHMQTICTSLQTDNHTNTNTSSLIMSYEVLGYI